MSGWHYYNEQGKKIGPLKSSEEFQQLVRRGTITRETKIENAAGRTTLAKDVKGVTFPETQSPPRPVPPTAPPVQVPLAAPPPPVNVFCTNCGNSVSAQAVACMSCGAKPIGHKKFCRHCGVALNAEQVVCIKCGAGLAESSMVGGFAANITSAFQTMGGAPSFDMNKNRNIYLLVFLICTAVGALLCIGGFVQVFHAEPTLGEVAIAFEMDSKGKSEKEIYNYLSFRRVITSPIILIGFIALIVGVVGLVFCAYKARFADAERFTNAERFIDAEQRKKRINFWTACCIVTFAVSVFIGLLTTIIGLRGLAPSITHAARTATPPFVVEADYPHPAYAYPQPAYSQVLFDQIIPHQPGDKQGDFPQERLDPMIQVPLFKPAEVDEPRPAVVDGPRPAVGKIVSGKTFLIGGVLLCPFLLAYLCCYYFYVLRLWEEVPREFSRTIPEWAAGFSLFPIFTWFWTFVALRGLFADMNKATESYGLGSRFNVSLIGVACIAWLIMGVLVLGINSLLIIGMPEDISHVGEERLSFLLSPRWV